MTCNILWLTKGQSGFVFLAAYPISTVIPLDLSSESSMISLPALYMRHGLPDIQLFDIPQVVTFLVETILSLHVKGFQPTFYCEKKIGWIFILHIKYFAAD